MKEEFDFYNMTSLKSYNLDEQIRYQLSILDGLDAFTRKHCEHVANLTCRLCEYLGLDRGFTVYCTICAYLHDVGKIFIPPAVLQKPGKLTQEEYEIMKTHTTIGYKMCVKDIPYEAQIIRVADEYDAITSKRQYKTHIGTIDTLKILIDETKPTQPQSLSLNPKVLSEKTALGKIDKEILKALFKVCYDDVEYEIAARINYIEFLKKDLKRLRTALSYYEKMEKSILPQKKEYYREYAKAYLVNNEQVELIPDIYNQMRETLINREQHLQRLYVEAKDIKRLKI